MQGELSPIQQIARALVARHGREAHAVLAAMLDRQRVTVQAAIAHDWQGLWARPKQRIPSSGRWRSWGLLTGRGFGKTRSIAEYLNGEVREGRAQRIALIAQNEDKTFEVMVDGPSGLIATAPPWCRPRWEKSRLVWPNGAEAFVFTPEVPGALRGPEHDHAWMSEIVAWPPSTRDEAWSNLRFGLRKRQGRLLWDTTPKRRHPLIRYLLERSKKYPELHVVVRGSMRENADNLTPEVVAELEEEFGGTRRGQEELEGIFFDESDGALWKQEWIDMHRREWPTRLERRVLAVDPAISTREGTDATGIVDLGLGKDGQVHVLGDWSERAAPEDWIELVIDRYVGEKCDCVVTERNRGGDLVTALLRAHAKHRGIAVVARKSGAPTRHAAGVITVVEVEARRSKEDRATPVAAAYERGRVSHTIGVDLTALEDELTTWEPPAESAKRQASPNRLDALVHGVWELLRLGQPEKAGAAGFAGLKEANQRLTQPSGGSLGALLVRGGRGTI